MTYRLKNIEYFSRKVQILCQNENGPCPLIAIANILLLQGHIHVHPDYVIIDLPELIQLVADRLLNINDNRSGGGDDVSRVQQVGEVIELLPRMQFGLDVNLKFNKVDSFEFTTELSVFDAFDITLLHGWLPDRQSNPEFSNSASPADLISCLSYNQLCYRVIDYNQTVEREQLRLKGELEEIKNGAGGEGRGGVTEVETRVDEGVQRALEEGRVLKKFLEDTASQLTYAGIVALHQVLRERQLAVLFRNNHFGTIVRVNGKIYQLVTDLGYSEEASVVWESLDVIDGDTEYFDALFRPCTIAASQTALLREITSPAPDRQQPTLQFAVTERSEEVDSDFLLALQLQQEQYDDGASAQASAAPGAYIGQAVAPAPGATAGSGAAHNWSWSAPNSASPAVLDVSQSPAQAADPALGAHFSAEELAVLRAQEEQFFKEKSSKDKHTSQSPRVPPLSQPARIQDPSHPQVNALLQPPKKGASCSIS